MSYFTAINSKLLSFKGEGKLIWEEGDFTVIESGKHIGSRWYLYCKQWQISEILDGKSGFMRQHKGDFHKWIDKIRKKDVAKVANLRASAKQIEADADTIESIWS